MPLPNDPIILMSFLNTMLRDKYENLDKLCDDYNISKNIIIEKMLSIGYNYNKTQNQFK